MHIKVHWKTFHPICFINLPPTQNSREALHTAPWMYCTIHLLEIIRLSDFSSPLFYPSLLASDPQTVWAHFCIYPIDCLQTKMQTVSRLKKERLPTGIDDKYSQKYTTYNDNLRCALPLYMETWTNSVRSLSILLSLRSIPSPLIILY
jgi:hypothetical protein